MMIRTRIFGKDKKARIKVNKRVNMQKMNINRDLKFKIHSKHNNYQKEIKNQ